MPLFFQRTENNQTVQIAVEYDLIDIAPDMMSPKLVYLFYKPATPVTDFETFFIQDPLIEALTQIEGVGYFAGARYAEGWVELYYYTQDSKLLRHIIADHFTQSLQHEMGSKPDEAWRFFFDKLKPKPKEALTIQNKEVQRALIEAGDDLSLVHTFTHEFFFSTASLREKLKNTLLEMGHVVVEEAMDDALPAHPYVLVSEHEAVFDLDAVNAMSTAMHDLAGKYHALYEGWTTTLAKGA